MTEGNGNGNGQAPAHLDWLRTRHEKITARRTLDKDVPGYQGRLVVRYVPPPWPAIAKAQALMAEPGRNGEGLLYAQADVLVAACVEVLFRQEDGAMIPVDPSGETRRFDPELADLFKLEEAKTARATIRGVFGNDLAMTAQAGEVITWAMESRVEADEELAGEFDAAVM
jgi:hypothetical protein